MADSLALGNGVTVTITSGTTDVLTGTVSGLMVVLSDAPSVLVTFSVRVADSDAWVGVSIWRYRGADETVSATLFTGAATNGHKAPIANAGVVSA
jgi:hypothetical protein